MSNCDVQERSFRELIGFLDRLPRQRWEPALIKVVLEMGSRLEGEMAAEAFRSVEASEPAVEALPNL